MLKNQGIEIWWLRYLFCVKFETRHINLDLIRVVFEHSFWKIQVTSMPKKEGLDNHLHDFVESKSTILLKSKGLSTKKDLKFPSES